MPGIAGVITRGPAAANQQTVVCEMLKRMRHEPSYASATMAVPEVGLTAGWTGHADSSGRAECETRADAAVNLVMSGECFQGPSAIALYAEHGVDFLGRLNGQFCGVLTDRQARRVMLFTDRYGMERVYLHETPDATYFASEVKALLTLPSARRGLDDTAVAEWLTYNCVSNWRTLFRGIECMPGGTVRTFVDGDSRERRYFDLQDWRSQEPLSDDAFEAEFDSTFRSIVPAYMRAQARTGISLTGGLDSRMVVACLPSMEVDPISYTFAGQHSTVDDEIAGSVAAACDLEHQVLRVNDDFFDSFPALVDRTVYVTDGCAGATTAHELYLNAKARRLAPIRVTGNFGSEVLRNSPAFVASDLSAQLFAPDFEAVVSQVRSRQERLTEHPAEAAAFKQVPWALFGTLAAARSQVVFRSPYLDNAIVSLACRASQRQSSESALRLIAGWRPCLRDIQTDRARGLPGSRVLWRRLWADATFKLDYLDTEGLPNWLTPVDPLLSLLNRAGIGGRHKYLPYRRWFRSELASYVRSVLTDPETARLPYLNGKSLGTIADEHIRGVRNNLRAINAVLSLSALHRTLLRP